MNPSESTQNAAEPVKRRERPYVYIQRARCPECGSDRLRTLRSTQGGDGSVSRRSVCGDCQARCTVVVE